jgi:hypothetical protein
LRRWTRPAIPQAAKAAAGWHICFEGLAGRLDGTQRPATKAALDELDADYASRFAIAPGG